MKDLFFSYLISTDPFRDALMMSPRYNQLPKQTMCEQTGEKRWGTQHNMLTRQQEGGDIPKKIPSSTTSWSQSWSSTPWFDERTFFLLSDIDRSILGHSDDEPEVQPTPKRGASKAKTRKNDVVRSTICWHLSRRGVKHFAEVKDFATHGSYFSCRLFRKGNIDRWKLIEHEG